MNNARRLAWAVLVMWSLSILYCTRPSECYRSPAPSYCVD